MDRDIHGDDEGHVEVVKNSSVDVEYGGLVFEENYTEDVRQHERYNVESRGQQVEHHTSLY